MALSNNKKSLCNKLVSDFDALIQPGVSAKGAVNSAVNDMKSKLNGMKGNFPTPGLDGALEAYRQAVNDALPGDGLDDMNDIKDFIDSCEYLQIFAPVSAMMGTVNGIFDEIDKLANGLDLSFPEFGVGNLGSLVDKLLDAVPGLPGGDKISDLLALADKLLNCLSAGCAAVDPTYITDLTQKSDQLQSVYDDLGIIDDPNDPNYGKFDYASMYNDLGLSTNEIAAIDSVKGGINASKDSGINAIKNTTDAMKNLKKLGGGLF